MKKTITLLGISFIFFAISQLHGQELLAKWTFPTGEPADSLADGGTPANLTMAIRTEGGTSTIDFSKNGATTKAAQATGWDNGAMTKCWVISVNTTGYENLKLSSKQQTGGNNPGPLDWAVQFRVGTTGSWTDLPNSTLVAANNWTSAVLDSIDLPAACWNRPLLFLRWVMTTNANSSGGIVEPSGINKIDDIYITGKLTSTGADDPDRAHSFRIWPNPANGPVTVTSPLRLDRIEIIDMHGVVFFTCQPEGNANYTISRGNLPAGTYLVRVRTVSGKIMTKQLIVR